MIDHLVIYVKNFEQSLSFYDRTLNELSYIRVMTLPEKRLLDMGLIKSLIFG